MEKRVVGRFAPSPSGYMHIGNLLSMLLAWLDCRSQNGYLVFRMEDLDPNRSKSKYIHAIEKDLRWLGLIWDTGYPDPDYCQSNRKALYDAVFQELSALGLVYPCFCTRAKRLAAASAPHPGEDISDCNCPCARMSRREQTMNLASMVPAAWKIRVPDETVTISDELYGEYTLNLARDVGDFILRRADGVYAYQLAATADDLAMGINRVVRGSDLLRCAPQQAWLTRILGGTPPSYCHTPLLLSGYGQKLSKRIGSLSTEQLREDYSASALLGYLACLCGLLPKPEPTDANALVKIFSWDKIKSGDILLPDNFR